MNPQGTGKRSSKGTRRVSGRLLRGGLFALALACIAFAAPDDGVDFSLCPAAGLKFKLVDEQSMRCTGKVVLGDNEQDMDLTESITATETYVQTMLETRHGEVVALEREYEDVSQKIVAETSIPSSKPQEIEQTLAVAWKHYRARWKDGELTLEVKAEDSWQEPAEAARKRLTAQALRNPIVPLPQGNKSIGDSWELDAKALRDYFTDVGEIGGSAESPVDGSARFKFAAIEDLDGDRCAVIDFEIKLEVGSDDETYSFTLAGKIHYSLRHRIPVRMQGEGPLEVKSDREQLGRAMNVRLQGTRSMNRTVKVLAAGKTLPAGKGPAEGGAKTRKDG